MLAVLAPGLGQRFEFGVGQPLAEADRRRARAAPRIGDVGLDRLHLLQVKSQHPLFADPQQLLVGHLEVDLRAGKRLVGPHDQLWEQ